MKVKNTIKILEAHNKYRRDNNVPSIYPMTDPKELGKAIDFACYNLQVLEDIQAKELFSKEDMEKAYALGFESGNQRDLNNCDFNK